MFASEAVNQSTFGPWWRREQTVRDEATQIDLIG